MTLTARVVVAVLMSTLAAAGCAGSADKTNDESTPDDVAATESALGGPVVGMTMRSFTPKNLVVKKGTIVSFTNISPVSHTVTSGASSRVADHPGALFDAVVAPKATFNVTFNQIGVQPYFCCPHEQMGMSGTITVTN